MNRKDFIRLSAFIPLIIAGCNIGSKNKRKKPVKPQLTHPLNGDVCVQDYGYCYVLWEYSGEKWKVKSKSDIDMLPFDIDRTTWYEDKSQ